MRKSLIIGFLIGLAIPPSLAAINVGVENMVMRDIIAVSILSSTIIKYGETPGIYVDSYAKADKMMSARNFKR